MKKKVNNEFPLMEKVGIVEGAMKSRGWNKSKLTAESTASSAAVTRFFQDGKISSENVLKIICTLDLFGKREYKAFPYKQKNFLTHEQVEEILNSDDDDAKSALNYTVKGVLKLLGSKEKTERLLEEISGKLGVLLELKSDLTEDGSPGGSESTGG